MKSLYVYVCEHCLYVCMYVWMDVCICQCMYVCMYMFIHICLYVCMYVRMLYVCIFLFLYDLNKLNTNTQTASHLATSLGAHGRNASANKAAPLIPLSKSYICMRNIIQPLRARQRETERQRSTLRACVLPLSCVLPLALSRALSLFRSRLLALSLSPPLPPHPNR